MSIDSEDVTQERAKAWGSRASAGERTILGVFVGAPFVAVIAGAVVFWNHGIAASDVIAAGTMYALAAIGIGVGYHRLFTHMSFRAVRPLRAALACLGTLAIEGDVITWVADHRRHHQYSDRPGDPHSPWRFGTSIMALAKGLMWAHFSWMFFNETTNKKHYAPDLLNDRAVVRIVRLQPVLVVASFVAPALIGAAVGHSWASAISGFFWGGLVRVGLLHHVTWSINSICHAFGERPYRSRDRSGNVWWLAIPSAGESWHNYHHADPTSARHGVLPMQWDIAARVIWILERAGWAYDVNWPTRRRIESHLESPKGMST